MNTCYSAVYTSQTRNQQHLTTLELEANGTATHYASLHCPRGTVGYAV